MKRYPIARVLDTIAPWIEQFHETLSVEEMAEKRGDAFAVLIATLVSLRTREEVTRPVMWRVIEAAPSPEAMLALDVGTLQSLLEPATFADTKAERLHAMCKQLVDDHGGEVPNTLEGLLSLRGVGRKTANLVLILGFGKPGICVDIHVHRICNRLGYVKTSTADETELVLRETLPKAYWRPINRLLVTFGRHQCVPVSPKCSTCPVAGDCKKVGVTRHR